MQTIDYSSPNALEAQLIEEARAGDISGLVEYLYECCLLVRARRLVRGFQWAYGAYLDAEDVAMEGVVRVMIDLDKALARPGHVIGYLLHAAQLCMMNYCQEQRGIIRVPKTSQQKGHKVPVVASLDAPLPGTDDFTLLDVLPALAS
jgi:hypothetical protein